MTSDDAGARAFMAAHRITFPSLGGRDSGLPEKYDVHGTPTNVVIDREGRVLFRTVGFEPSEGTAKLEAYLESAL